jgi:hypothetical protein
VKNRPNQIRWIRFPKHPYMLSRNRNGEDHDLYRSFSPIYAWNNRSMDRDTWFRLAYPHHTALGRIVFRIELAKYI